MNIIEVGRITSRIIGNIENDHLETLRYQLSYEEPGAFFKQRHNRFARDRHYMITEKRQEFRTGLLQRVCGLCEEIGIDFQIIDKRQTGEPDHFMPLRLESTMRDYQSEAINVAIREKTGMVRIATGGGKTRVMAGIVATLERRAVVLVHRLDLLHQVLDTLGELMQFQEVIGRVGGGVYEPNLITVCTVQTLCAALGITYDPGGDDDKEKATGALAHADEIKAMLNDAQVVLVDEAHHAPAKTISDVLKRCVNATWRIGMSATDWRDDGADLLIEAAIGPRIFDVSLSNLVELGFLVSARITMYPMRSPAKGYLGGDLFASLYKHYYTENGPFNLQVLETNAKLHAEGRHILTLVTAVKHGERLQALHQEAGMETVFLSGRDTTSRRSEVLRDVRSGRLRHLIGTSIADEGLDMPILDALTLAGGGKSTTKAYQRVGRVLRIYEGKSEAIVTDFRCRDAEALKKHAGRRVGVYKKEPCFEFRELK